MNCVGECVGARRRLVAAVRRETRADHVQAGVDRLQRVVRLGEQLLERRRGGVRSIAAELGLPEEVEVRLVADDHVADVRERTGERRGVGRRTPPDRRQRGASQR